MKRRTRPYDVAEFLNTPERIVAYLREAFDSGEIDLMLVALRNAARGASAFRRTTFLTVTGTKGEQVIKYDNLDGT